MISKNFLAAVWLMGTVFSGEVLAQQPGLGRRAPAISPKTPRTGAATNAAAAKLLPELPPLPEGVAELKFVDFFKTPVGPRGLEVTEKLKALDGKRVRIYGFMAREEAAHHDEEEEREPGRFLLTPLPVTLSASHYGLCDDLPPQTLYVAAAHFKGRFIQYTPGPMLLTGVLSLGNRVEGDGRISVARLALDGPETPKEFSKDHAAGVSAGDALKEKQTTLQVTETNP